MTSKNVKCAGEKTKLYREISKNYKTTSKRLRVDPRSYVFCYCHYVCIQFFIFFLFLFSLRRIRKLQGPIGSKIVHVMNTSFRKADTSSSPLRYIPSTPTERGMVVPTPGESLCLFMSVPKENPL